MPPFVVLFAFLAKKALFVRKKRAFAEFLKPVAFFFVIL